MNQTRNEKLDAAILKGVGKGKNRFMKIQASIPRDADFLWNDRSVDRRLQVLRKKGKLAYAAKTGWTIPVKEKKVTTPGAAEGTL